MRRQIYFFRPQKVIFCSLTDAGEISLKKNALDRLEISNCNKLVPSKERNLLVF